MPAQSMLKAPIFQQQEQLTSFETTINEALLAIKAKDLNKAETILNRYSLTNAPKEQLLLLCYAKSKLALANDNWSAAKTTAFYTQLDDVIPSSANNQQVALYELRVIIAEHLNNPLLTAKQKIHLAAFIKDQTLSNKNANSIWTLLNTTPINTIINEYQKVNNHDEKLWYSLILNQTKDSLNERIVELEQIKNNNPHHASQFIIKKLLSNLHNEAIKQNQVIAIILPFRGKYAAFSQAILDGFLSNYYHSTSQPQLRLYNAEDETDFMAIYQKAINEGANIIIGPLLKNQLEKLYQYKELPIPTIALNKIDKPNKPKKLLEFTLSSEDEVQLLVKVAESKKLNRAFVIYQNDDASNKNMQAFSKQWLSLGHSIIGSVAINQATEVASKLEGPLHITNSQQRTDTVNASSDTIIEANVKARDDIDCFFVFSTFDTAKETNTLIEYYYPDINRFATSSIYRGYADSTADPALNQFIFSDITIFSDNNALIPNAYNRSSLIRLFALGKDAFTMNEKYGEDTVFAGDTGTITINNLTSYRTPTLYQFKNNKISTVTLTSDDE